MNRTEVHGACSSAWCLGLSERSPSYDVASLSRPEVGASPDVAVACKWCNSSCEVLRNDVSSSSINAVDRRLLSSIGDTEW